MRFRLTLEVTGYNNHLPVNYQYELSSWIFHAINNSNNDFARWLHEKGFCYGNRKFKFFTFSKLVPGKYYLKGDRLVLESRYAQFITSFYLPMAAEHFIKGLFKDQSFRLGDKISSVEFRIMQIEKLPEVNFLTKMNFRTVSPVIISHYDGVHKYAQYISPENELYPEQLYNNLISKYVAIAETVNKDFTSEEAMAEHEFCFSIENNPKQKLIRIKAGKEGETYLKGFEYSFSLTAPVELIKIGYYAGFGEKNSLGFGCVEVENI